MRQLVTPTSVEDQGAIVDIYERDADPAVDQPYATAYRATSYVHENGRRYVAVVDGSPLSRRDYEVDLYLSEP